jgi:hypothetical protein
MLIYIRKEDAAKIMEALPDEAVPQHVRDYMAQPDDTGTSYSASGYKTAGDFAIYDIAKCLRQNALSAVTGFKCEEFLKKAPFTSRDTHNSIYAAAATALGLAADTFEIWYGATACPTTFFERSEFAAQWMDYYTFFVRRLKPASTPHSATSVTMYLKFFCPDWEQQMQYIGDVTLASSKTVVDLIEIVNERLGLPAGTVLEVYEESLNKNAKKLAYRITSTLMYAFLNNGALLIFQIPPGEPIPEISFQPKAARRSSVVEPAETVAPAPAPEAADPGLPLFSISDADTGRPTSIEQYFARSVTSSVDITLFDYLAPTVALAILKCPLSTSIDALAQFVISVRSLALDPDHDTLVLYKKDTETDGPNKTALRPDWYPTIQYDFEKVAGKEKKRFLFYRVLRGISPAEYEAGSIQTITFVDESRTVIKVEDVCLPKTLTVEILNEKLGQINFFGTDQRERKGIVVEDWECTLITPTSNLWYNRRLVYVVVENLVRDLQPTERLLLVSEGTISSSDYLVPAGIPGFIKISADMTLADARPALGQLFGLDTEKLKKVKFFACTNWARFAPAEAMKDDFCFRGLKKHDSLYIVINLKRKSTRARVADESIHINN